MSRARNPYRLPDGRPRTTREEQVVFESPLVTVGLFDARVEDVHFRRSDPPEEHIFVFPLTAVRIQKSGETAFVADRNRITFYNPDRQYRRIPVSPSGDRGHWFAVAPGILEEIVGKATGFRAAGDRVFPASVGSSTRAAFLSQLDLVRRLIRQTEVDAMEVEESVFGLAQECLGSTDRLRERDPSVADRRLSGRAREWLALQYTSNKTISTMAADIGASPCHLSRVFRRTTGLTLHTYREQLRLRRACLELPERAGDLSGLALDLGYSSHSHFTFAFRRAFGLPPSRRS